MTIILILILACLMGLVVISLIRGIVAFLKTTKSDLESGESGTVAEMQKMQNRAMFARIKFQALAVVTVVILLAVAQ